MLNLFKKIPKKPKNRKHFILSIYYAYTDTMSELECDIQRERERGILLWRI
jgi:hypothetical protein